MPALAHASSALYEAARPTSRYSLGGSTYVQISSYISSSEAGRSLTEFTQDDTNRSRILHDLITLATAEADEIPVSRFAIAQALGLVGTIVTFMQHATRKPRVVDDGGGGIRMTWRTKEREVRIALPSEAKGERYLYWDAQSKYDIVSNFTEVTLFDRLSWLYGHEPA